MQARTASSEFADATRQSKPRRRRESQRPKIGAAYRRGIRCCWRFVLHHRSLPPATRQSKSRRRRESQRPKIGAAYRRGIRCHHRLALHHRSLPTRRVNPNHAEGGNPKDQKSARRTAEVFVVIIGSHYIIGVCRRGASIQTTPKAGIPKTKNRRGVPPGYSLLLAVRITSSEFADAARQSKPRRRQESQKPKIGAAYRRDDLIYYRDILLHLELRPAN